MLNNIKIVLCTNNLIREDMEDKVFQVLIVLRDSKPKIWRRLLVPSSMLLSDFHKVIQTSVGWENVHFHHFIKDNFFYTVKMENDDFWDEVRNRDYKEIKVSDLLNHKHDKIIYEYDFGDSWLHDIILEEIDDSKSEIKYPVCIDGKMSAPPEDSGGILGYHNILEIIKNPEHKYYENYRDWLDEDFDPEYFNIDEVNKLLADCLL